MGFKDVLFPMNTDCKDHSKAVKKLMESAIDVYTSKPTAQALALSGHRLNIVEPMEQFKVGSWTCKGFPLPHDADNMGFLLASGDERLLYCTDCHYIPYRFEGLTAMMLEVNYSLPILEQNIRSGLVDIAQIRRVLTSHMSLQTALDFLKANDLSRVEEIFLLHLSSGNSIAELFQKEVMRQTGIPTYISEV